MNQRILSILEDKGVRPTAMRMLVLEQFLHRSAAQSLGELEKELPRSDRITLFRTLKTFAEKAILHTIEDGSGATRYALCDEHCLPGHHTDQHPHFHCEECGQTTCLENISFVPAISPSNYQVHRTEYIMHGLCPACQK